MSLSLSDISTLLLRRGSAQYGDEAVSQLQHALQSAALAEQANESPETVVAALLHDLGHLIVAERDGVDEADSHRDELHQYIVLPFLRGLFPESVLAPIRLHVDAKRFLCAMEAGYAETLSPASVASLALQGGPFSPEEAAQFAALPHAATALRLRRYDDQAKVSDWHGPDLAHFEPLMAMVAAKHAES
ncbi:MAG: HD domain-containing protein [Curvibacter sp.]|nr:MAG: HD domain-containing protein [Curvibacter sp.]